MTLREMIQTVAALMKVVQAGTPLPGVGEVRSYLKNLGIDSPTADVIEPLWEAGLARNRLVTADETLRQIAALPAEEAQAALVAAARDAGTKLDPSTLALIVQLVQTLGPVLIQWIKDRWADRKTEPQPIPTPTI